MRRYLVVDLVFDRTAGGGGDFNPSYFSTDDVDEADRLAGHLYERQFGWDGHRVEVQVIDTTTTGWVRDVTERLRELNELEDELR